ncbi:MAG: hypothetical protein J6A55_01160 [Oscillospiraceae bacterium]|nr:hypothetical protein [Oscillospiraceae bacterium]
MADNKFFTYKGYPLVRKGKELYYGNMGDEFVIWIQILAQEDVNDIKTATRVRLYKISTEQNVPVKNAEKSSLYSALDIAYAWLTN